MKNLIVAVMLAIMTGLPMTSVAKRWPVDRKYRFLTEFVERELKVKWTCPKGADILDTESLLLNGKTVNDFHLMPFGYLQEAFSELSVEKPSSYLLSYPSPWLVVSNAESNLQQCQKMSIGTIAKRVSDSIAHESSQRLEIGGILCNADTVVISEMRLKRLFLGKYPMAFYIYTVKSHCFVYLYRLFLTEKEIPNKEKILDTVIKSIRYTDGDNRKYEQACQQRKAETVYRESVKEYLKRKGFPQIIF